MTLKNSIVLVIAALAVVLAYLMVEALKPSPVVQPPVEQLMDNRPQY